MIENGRILCVNPYCGRTAAVEKMHDANGIVCGKCWRKLPQELRDRYRVLKRRDRRIERLALKRAAKGVVRSAQLNHLESLLRGHQQRNWSRIRNYFLRPESPIGLEGFLKEVGL